MDKYKLLEKQLNSLHRGYSKYEKDIAILKKNSHEPREFVCCKCCENKIKEK